MRDEVPSLNEERDFFNEGFLPTQLNNEGKLKKNKKDPETQGKPDQSTQPIIASHSYLSAVTWLA